MAYGSNSSGKTLLFTFMNLSKDDDKAYFEVYDPEQRENIDECDFVEGKLIEIKFGDGEFKDKSETYKTVEIILFDEESNTRYKLKCKFQRFTIVMRNILNRLLTAKSFDNIYIAYFGNKGEYKNVSVRCNNEKLDYMYSYQELDEKVDHIKDKSGKTIKNDYSDLDEFLIEKINDIVVPQLPKRETKVSRDETKDDSESKGENPHEEFLMKEESKENQDFEVPPSDDLPF